MAKTAKTTRKRKNDIIAVSYISIGGAPPVPFDSLTPEKRQECVSKMMDNIGKTVSDYLSSPEHYDEAKRFIEEAQPC